MRLNSFPMDIVCATPFAVLSLFFLFSLYSFTTKSYIYGINSVHVRRVKRAPHAKWLSRQESDQYTNEISEANVQLQQKQFAVHFHTWFIILLDIHPPPPLPPITAHTPNTCTVSLRILVEQNHSQIPGIA